ncbi:MAG: O-antigen ligase family protein [Clostridia bacterium]|nr:O-antigen ligase family protein [Clostridia bacterium]
MNLIQKRPSKSFTRSVANFFGKSAIYKYTCRFTSAIYKRFIYGFFGTIFTLYGSFAKALQNSFLVNLFAHKKDRDNNRTIGYKASRLCETSIFAHLVVLLKRNLLFCQLNTLGILGFSFGFYSAAIILLKKYAFNHNDISTVSLMVSVILVIVSTILLFSKKTLISVINESYTLNFIFFEFLAMRKISSDDTENVSHFSAASSVFFGMILGALSLVIEPYKIALGIFIMIACAVIINSPETGVITLFAALPFTPTMVLAGLVIVTAFSMFLKVIRRKRLIKIAPIDIAVLAFAIFVASGGVISMDIMSSIPKMLVFVCFMSIYFIIKNIIRSEQLAVCCVRSLTVGAVGVSVFGFFQYFFGSVSTIWQDTEMFSDIRGRAVSTFENPNVLGEYLILVIPVIFAMCVSSKHARTKFRYFVAFMLCSSCLILTWSRGAWLGFIVAVIIFILFSSHKVFACTLLGIPALLLGSSFFIDTSVINRFLSIGNAADSSTSYRLNIWKGTLNMLSDTWMYGIGIGTEAFASVYPRYALAGTEVAPHSHSLYLQITTEMGVFALAMFLLFCITFIGMVLSTLKNSSVKKLKLTLLGIFCGVCAFLIQGFTDYVWYNYRIFLLFWAIVGLGAALVNICKDEDSRRTLYM